MLGWRKTRTPTMVEGLKVDIDYPGMTIAFLMWFGILLGENVG
jgi:hypothetical protein